MAKELAYCPIFFDKLDDLRDMKDDERGKFILAVLDYAAAGVEPDDELFQERFFRSTFRSFKASVDSSRARYEGLTAKRSAAGKKSAAVRAEHRSTALSNAEQRSTQPTNTIKDYDQFKIREGDCSAEAEPARAAAKINYQRIVDDFNETCSSLPRVSKLSTKRKKAIRARLRTYTPEELHRVFVLAEGSDFLRGGNDRNWTATFDWLMQDGNAAKVLDGNYCNRDTEGRKSGRIEEFEAMLSEFTV